MSFIKLGEAVEITSADIESIDSINLNDSDINERFSKYASTLKRIAPKAEDFLYFSAIMMHAAEASLLNSDGSPKLDARGEPVKAQWEKKGESWRWNSTDSSIRPYKNSNGDIFPEEELVKAYQKWVGKPLCIDHKSSSVDAIRGLIVDTYYDRKLKRVIALCALDKVNYPDLARKVASGYATCVSMGTAVGKAVCSDCGQVAKTADDFCHHMRTKSCYGEINIDLQPIELSIVVNGADPKAKIKHIIASANNINRYIDSKQSQLSKASSLKDVEMIEDELKSLTEKVAQLKQDLAEVVANDESEMVSGVESVEQVEVEPAANLGTPPERFASDDAALELLNKMNNSLEKLASDIKSLKEVNSNPASKQEINNLENTASEKNMTMKKESYFQGGGGVNEPTPGQPKYEKEPMNEDLRNNGDKHMSTPSNTGPVDGLHPGDLEKKELLARAEAEQRAVRRAAALKNAKETLLTHKEAYYQGAGKESDPTPGKVKYPADPMNEKLREEDKHMNGAKPFPGVGDVEGVLGGKEEMNQKKLLQRASLKLRFVKAANADGSDNLGASAWHVLSGDKLVLTASVNELSGGKVEALYDVIATKEFGQKMLGKIKSLGFEKAMSIYKKADDMPAMPAAMPAPEAAAPMAPEAPAAEMPDMNKDGDPKEGAVELANQALEVISDLNEAVKGLAGEQTELDSVEQLPMAATAETKSLFNMRKELNSALHNSMKKAASELKEHETELRLIANILDKGAVTDSNESYINSIVEDAVADAKTAIADAYKLMGAFVKYARGTEALVKRAEAEVALSKTAQAASAPTPTPAPPKKVEDTLGDLAKDVEKSLPDAGSADDDEFDALFDEEIAGLLADDAEVEAMDASDGTVVELPAGAAVPAGAKAVTASFDLTTKEGRAAYRAKLASEADFSDVLDEAHSGGVTTKLDVKPSGDLAKVEDLEETHSAMMDLAKAPAKVRKDAEEIQSLVAEGKLAAEDVDALVAHGVDADAVKYWKQFYGEAGKEGGQFAGELVKEHAKAKSDEEVNAYKVKLARAYSLANEMVRRGIVAEDDSAVTAQVEEIMKWNDEGFESMKKLVAKQTVKTASARVPQVGVIGSGEVVQSAPESTIYEELVKAFAGKKH